MAFIDGMDGIVMASVMSTRSHGINGRVGVGVGIGGGSESKMVDFCYFSA